MIVDGKLKSKTGGVHNHMPHTDKIQKIQQKSQFIKSCDAPLESASEPQTIKSVAKLVKEEQDDEGNRNGNADLQKFLYLN